MLPYFKKSETFTPVSSLEKATFLSIEDDVAVHGTNGPVNVSFSDYYWNSSSVLFHALNELGVPTASDPNSGTIAGASFLPLDLNPDTQTRCSARNAYYDPYTSRPNLWVSTSQYVTQVLFRGGAVNQQASVSTTQNNPEGQGSSPGVPGGIFGNTTTTNASTSGLDTLPGYQRSLLHKVWRMAKRALQRRQASSSVSAPLTPANLVAIGVEYAANAQSPRANVRATREVIIAAGALHSPQLLMLSGIGSAPALEALEIPVKVDLPGVGTNLHDHGQVWCWYPYYNTSYPNPTELTSNRTFADDAWIDFWISRTGPFTTGAINGVAFPALPFIVNGSTAIHDMASSQSPAHFLPTGQDPTVIAGFSHQLPMLTAALADPTRASYELINANDGALTVANMRPFSRGTVGINSSNPFDPPVIDPRYLSNPIDTEVLLAAIRFNHRLVTDSALATEMDPAQLLPAPDATDAELRQYIAAKLQTEYHPAGTCAMMPREYGGVVSPELRVYGTANVRVVDSSVIPMLPAAHLQAVVYGIAEKVRVLFAICCRLCCIRAD